MTGHEGGLINVVPARRRKPAIPIFISIIGVVLMLGYIFYPFSIANSDKYPAENIWGIDRIHLATAISSPILSSNEFPNEVSISANGNRYDAVLKYTTDEDLRTYIEGLLKRYKPDYAAVAVLDPATGKVLATASFVRDGEPVGNLAFHSGFPAASLFKIVTAAATLGEGKANPSTIYKYNGKNSSLYKKNVLRHVDNKWTRKVALKKAFAVSINTVFGRIGVFDVGADNLVDYAQNFGFNRNLATDVHIEPSQLLLSPGDQWAVAEVASGYTRAITVSPVHAAMLVSAVANEGVMVDPIFVETAFHANGPILYTSSPATATVVASETANDLKVLMRETIKRGSARKSFRKFFTGSYKDLDVGGKTGSLTGYDPKGRTEWFAGYADSGIDKIAVAAVVVNKEKWRVKPAYLARKVFEEYFKPESSNG